MHPSFAHRLRQHERLIGTILTLPLPEFAEICAGLGYDWLFLDMEHGLLDPPGVQRIAQAAAGRIPCIVRVPANEDVWFKKALDLGVAGLVVPMVNSAEEAARAVRQSKFPPQGTRSVGLARAHGFGLTFQDYIDTANADTVVIVQCEHIQAVENIEAILQVPGIDGIFIGPYDLSASMGIPGQIGDPAVRQAIQHVHQACAARHMPVGTYAGDTAAGQKAFADGCSFVVVSCDFGLYAQAAGEVLDGLKKT